MDTAVPGTPGGTSCEMHRGEGRLRRETQRTAGSKHDKYRIRRDVGSPVGKARFATHEAKDVVHRLLRQRVEMRC